MRDQLREQVRALARMYDADGNDIGHVDFIARHDPVLVSAQLAGLDLPEDFYGFHLLETGCCDPDDPEGPFMSAGDHYDPHDAPHGDHAGDLPPLLVTRGGTARMLVMTDRFSVGELLGGGGTAMILHRDRDNLGHIPDRYQSQKSDRPGPDQETLDTGDAGGRVACGVVEGGGGSARR